MNAALSSVPPLIVWARNSLKNELMNPTPAGLVAAYHPSGWIQTDIFTTWFYNFESPLETTPYFFYLMDISMLEVLISLIELEKTTYLAMVFHHIQAIKCSHSMLDFVPSKNILC